MKHDCRKAFADQLAQLAASDPDIMIVTTDSRGSTALNDFYKQLPGQCVEAGIAEQDAVGIGAGLSLTGKKPFVCGPACFLMMRSQEQVKVDIAYSNTNVKIIGVSAGVSYGVLGATHHSTGDFAAAKTMPGLMILCPSDANQCGQMIEYLATYDGPAYLRMGRGAVEDVYEAGKPCFTPGKANVFEGGNAAAVLAIGEMVHPALEAQKLLREEGIHITVADFPTLRPFDEETVRALAARCGLLLTVEEHSRFGGLGDSVSTALEGTAHRMVRLGLPDEYLPCKKPDAIKAWCGMDAGGIADAVRRGI